MADPCIVVLISASAEWEAVKNILSASEIDPTPMGELFNHTLGLWRVIFFHGGWGKISAAASTQYAIDHFHPDLLINLGTCGGIKGRIEPGTILLVTKTIVYDIVEQMGDADAAITYYSTEPDLSWLSEEKFRTRKDQLSRVLRSSLLSADRDIVPGEIRMLVEKYGAVAADWESGAIAWVAKQNGVRCLILRGVTDLVSDEGGEAYGNVELFQAQTKNVMSRLIKDLPDWLAAIYT